jgi:5-methyltetrahydropteroyltriglutamate--homocysteine methyltransferase
MPEYLVALTGLHSRSEETAQATQDWERKRIDEKSLKLAFEKDCDSIVRLEKKAGARYVTDGQITLAWQDLFRPITEGFEGVSPGPMVRWFNTNTFFFAPVVSGAISTDGEAIWKAVEKRFVGHGSRLKVIVPDPLTFAELAEDKHYRSREALLFAYADAMHDEILSLQAHGAEYVQFSSPSLVARFRERPLSKSGVGQLAEAIRTALQGTGVRSGFHTYFGDASPYLPELLDDIPTDDIGVDLTQTDDSSLSSTGKGIIAGIVDSRTTYLEQVGTLSSRVERLAERTGSRSITLAPSADLRYIPRTAADEKLALLGELKEELSA